MLALGAEGGNAAGLGAGALQTTVAGPGRAGGGVTDGVMTGAGMAGGGVTWTRCAEAIAAAERTMVGGDAIGRLGVRASARSISWISARAVGGRWAGSFSKQRLINAAIGAGIAGLTGEGRNGGGC